MYNPREEYCCKATHFSAVKTPLPTSVIQQRGNVIVTRSQVISEGRQFHFPTEQHDSVSHIPHKNGELADDRISNSASSSVLNRSPSLEQCADAEYPHNDRLPASPATLPSVKTENDTGDTTEDKGGGRAKKTIPSFECQYCDKKFRHKSYFDYHLRTHTGERPFQCSMCDKSFFERSKLNRHHSSCHNVTNDNDNAQEDNTCPKCHKSFSRSAGLEAHMSTHHDGCRPFSCTKCNKKFSGLTALKNHEKAHQGVKNILCDLCGKGFLLKKYLDLHLSTTHKMNARKHNCPSCRKGFHSMKDLKRHQLMHSNTKSFTCAICQTSFKRKDNLNRHLKLTHLLTPEQINEEPVNTTPSKTPTAPGAPTSVVTNNNSSSLPVSMPVPSVNQVSVIKSTKELIMSIQRGQQLR